MQFVGQRREAVTVHQYMARVALVRVVVTVEGVPLDDNLHLTVAVHVGHRAVVGGITALGGSALSGIGRFVEWDVQITDWRIGREGVCPFLESLGRRLVGVGCESENVGLREIEVFRG